MLKTLTDTSTAESSPVVEPIQDAAAQAVVETPDAKVTAAEPSPADENKDAKPSSLLDVIRDVVNPEATESSTTESSITKTDATPVATTEAEKDAAKVAEAEAAKETDANVPFHNHPRWKAVLAERDALKTPATEYGLIQKYMADNSLTTEEVAQGYQMMALLKNDPAKARELLAPIVENLNRFVGAVLPEDLQKKVDDGLVDEDTAKGLAQERGRLATETHRMQLAQSNQQRQQQSVQVQTQQTLQANMSQAVTDWEASVKSRDADYAVKESFVVDKVKALLASANPQTPEDAVKIAQQAYDEVTKSLSAIVPRKPTAKVTISANSSASTAQPQPRSFKEAIALAAKG